MHPHAYDVVVIGYGGAGASAAIEASDGGSTVVVLEKSGYEGGSTRYSGGSFRQIVDREMAVEHFAALTKGKTPRDVIERYVDGLIDLPAWFERHGAEWFTYEFPGKLFPRLHPGSAFPNIPGGEALGSRFRVRSATTDFGGESVWQLLSRNVLKRGIPVLLEHGARRLLRDRGNGAVIGVEVDTSGGVEQIIAHRAVVLASGGFGWNPEYQEEYFGFSVPSLSPPARNTGDGVRMAAAVGAQLWHMRGVAAGFGFKFNGVDAAFWCELESPHFVLVDQHARRFADETGLELHAATFAFGVPDPVTGELDRLPSYLVFDERVRRDRPICRFSSGYNRDYCWSPDNSAEIERGWIITAATLGELGDKLGISGATLEETVRIYNESAAKGVDEFSRAPQSTGPIDKPPYYGVPIWPCIVNTQGGPRRNANGEIVDVFGEVIPGLLGAGELGSMWAELYPGAGNISEAIISGAVAGRIAAGYESRAARGDGIVRGTPA